MAKYPQAIEKPGNTAGSFTSGPYKGVLHTTEGKSAAGAFAAYTKNNSWPHFTVTFEKGTFECYQHVDTAVAARSLRNESGGVQTNRDSAIQIEIVGTCDVRNKDTWGVQYVENFPQAYLDGIASLMRWIEENTGVARTWMAAPLKQYPDSYGKDNGVRLTQEQWDSGSGWCGHQNVPENLHGDPGLINIEYLMGFTGGVISAPAPQPEPVPQPTPNPNIYRIGSSGEKVKEIQGACNFWGWNAGAVDGVFGPATEAAVKRAQSALKIPVDGIWGPQTQTAYENFVAEMQGLAKKQQEARPILRKGDRGDWVKVAQKKLGYLTVDGVFGERTHLRTIKIQRLHGLTQDGIIGPNTWAVLDKL